MNVASVLIRRARRRAEGSPRTLRLLLAALLALVSQGTAACGTSAPGGGHFGGEANIDWIDSVRFGGVVYDSYSTDAGRPLRERDLGPVLDRVRFRLAENVRDPGYRMKDGDAAYLEPGTPVFRVKGYRPEFRLAARVDGELRLYEAFQSTRAKRGGDVVDIGGKVRRITINRDQAERPELIRVGVIGEPGQVESLVRMVLEAPFDARSVDRGYGDGTPRYFVSFRLEDGTAYTRSYWPGAGELSHGIMLPPAFAAAVEEAVRR